MRINKFRDFVTQVYEVSIDNTYLSSDVVQKKIRATPKYKEKFGKVFAGAQTSADKSWGLKFEQTAGDKFLVIFPDDFMKHFVFKTSEDEQEKLKAEISEILKRIKITIHRESSSNRTHFPAGIPGDLMGLGLGYIIYEEFIKFLGFACSYDNASTKAQKVWSKIAQDPDFYGLVTIDSILVVWKDCPEDILREAESRFVEEVEKLVRTIYRYNFIENNGETISGIHAKDISDKEKCKEFIKLFDTEDYFLFRMDDEILDMFESVVELINSEINRSYFVFNFKNKYKKHQSLKQELNAFYSKTNNLEELNKFYQETIKDAAEELEREGILNEDGEKPATLSEHLKNIYLQHFRNLETILKKIYLENGYEKAQEFFDSKIASQLEIPNIPTYQSGEAPQQRLRLQISTYQSTYISSQLRDTLNKDGLAATLKICDSLKDKLKDNKQEVGLDYNWATNTLGKYFKNLYDKGIDDLKMTPLQHLDLHIQIFTKAEEAKVKTRIKKDYRNFANKIHSFFLKNGAEATKTYFTQEFDKVLQSSPNLNKELVYDESNYNIDKPGKNIELTIEEHLKRRLEKYAQKEIEDKKQEEIRKELEAKAKRDAQAKKELEELNRKEAQAKKEAERLQKEAQDKAKKELEGLNRKEAQTKKEVQKQPPNRVKRWWEFWR